MPLWLWDFFAYWGMASAACCLFILVCAARLYQLNSNDDYL